MKNLILTSKQIYKIDKITTEKYLIPSMILMENAGRSVAEFVKKIAEKRKFKNILIFCGPGKNGGDGFVAARYLFIYGFNVKVITFVEETRYTGDVLQNYQILKKFKLKIERFNYTKLKKEIKNYHILIDAIFGIGLSRNIEGIFKKAVQLINESKKMILSVDIPSGLNSDTGEVMGVAVRSNYTITMGFLKIGLCKKQAKKYTGKLIVSDIGYPYFIIKFL